MKLASWNVNSLNVRLARLIDWLAANDPDIVCLQETKIEDAKFPVAPMEAAGYRVFYAGQRTYNGVAILARRGLDVVDIVPGVDDFVDEQKRLIAATVAGIRVICAYVPNGQVVDSEKYRYKLTWCEAVGAHLKNALARHPLLIVAGDFYFAPHYRDFYRPALLAGRIHFSHSEPGTYCSFLCHWAVRSF